MPNYNSPTALLEARAERLAREQDEIAVRLNLVRAFGDDEYEVGAVIRFDKYFERAGRAYSYVAIKCENGFWYTSGPIQGGTPRTWDELVAWLASGPRPTTELWLVESYAEVTA